SVRGGERGGSGLVLRSVGPFDGHAGLRGGRGGNGAARGRWLAYARRGDPFGADLDAGRARGGWHAAAVGFAGKAAMGRSRNGAAPQSRYTGSRAHIAGCESVEQPEDARIGPMMVRGAVRPH